jgi:acyl-CoA oxidase
VNEQCGELRPHSRTLVDAFAIPQEWLACAILDEEDVRQDATLAEDLRVRGSAGSPGAAGELDTAAAQ